MEFEYELYKNVALSFLMSILQMSGCREEDWNENYLEKVNFSSLWDSDQFNINTSHNSMFTFQDKKEKICLKLS